MYQEKSFHYLGPVCEIFVILLILYESISIFQKIDKSPECDVQKKLTILFSVILVLFILYIIIKFFNLNDDIALVIDTIFIVGIVLLNNLF